MTHSHDDPPEDRPNRAQRRAQAKTARRYVLACSICGTEFDASLHITLGEIHRDHYMRWHDTAKITFVLLDRQRGRERVREVRLN